MRLGWYHFHSAHFSHFPRSESRLDKYHEMFEWSRKNCSVGLSEHLIKKYQSVIDFLLADDIENKKLGRNNDVTNKEEFLRHTEKLDTIRNQSLQKSIPDLYKAIQYYE